MDNITSKQKEVKGRDGDGSLRSPSAARSPEYILKHRCGHTVDYSVEQYWLDAGAPPPADWAEDECDDCEDARADRYPARFSVMAQRRESGEWAGDR